MGDPVFSSTRDFEQSSSQLAHTKLQAEAPLLMRSLLGFQLIDTNDKQTHGLGVFGFRVGGQVDLVPSFFLNGELKQPAIYLPNQDLFLPLRDNWATFLVNRSPAVLGDSIDPTGKELGMSGPDLTSMTIPRYGVGSGAAEFSSAKRVQDWAHPVAQMFRPGRGELIKLADYLGRHPRASRVLRNSMARNRKLAEAVLRFYPNMDLTVPARNALRAKRASAPKPPVEVLFGRGGAGPVPRRDHRRASEARRFARRSRDGGAERHRMAGR